MSLPTSIYCTAAVPISPGGPHYFPEAGRNLMIFSIIHSDISFLIFAVNIANSVGDYTTPSFEALINFRVSAFFCGIQEVKYQDIF